MVIHDQNGPKNITIQEALLFGQIKKAMSGDTKAFQQIVKMLPPPKLAEEIPEIIISWKD